MLIFNTGMLVTIIWAVNHMPSVIGEDNPQRLWLVGGVFISVVVVVTVELAAIGRIFRGRWVFCGIERRRGGKMW